MSDAPWAPDPEEVPRLREALALLLSGHRKLGRSVRHATHFLAGHLGATRGAVAAWRFDPSPMTLRQRLALAESVADVREDLALLVRMDAAQRLAAYMGAAVLALEPRGQSWGETAEAATEVCAPVLDASPVPPVPCMPPVWVLTTAAELAARREWTRLG